MEENSSSSSPFGKQDSCVNRGEASGYKKVVALFYFVLVPLFSQFLVFLSRSAAVRCQWRGSVLVRSFHHFPLSLNFLYLKGGHAEWRASGSLSGARVKTLAAHFSLSRRALELATRARLKMSGNSCATTWSPVSSTPE